jgi:hypothetical protein
MSTMETFRNTNLATLAGALNDQRTRALDLRTPAKSLSVVGGRIVVMGMDPVVSEHGVTDPNGLYVPTATADAQIADALDIPVKYLRRLREQHIDLYDTNVNEWLNRSEKRHLVRLLTTQDGPDVGGDGNDGVMRALLAPTYKTIDNFDVLLAALNAINETSGQGGATVVGDLTERRMIVRVQSTVVGVNARALLGNYRSPFSGLGAADLPMLWAGFELTNSETGHGAFAITPRAVFEVCTNGMTIAADAKRKVHLGANLDDGVVAVSDETIAANLALVTAQTKDAVRAFMSAEYWQRQVDRIAEQSTVEVADPQQTITAVGKSLGFTQEQQTSILNMFIDGGLRTAGGVMQAVTAAAQQQSDGDAARDMEHAALDALRLAASPRALARAGRGDG